MKKFLTLALAVLMMISMAACSTPTVDETPKTQDTSISGTFTGSSAGMQGTVTVEMTVEGGQITNVAVV